MAIKIVKSQSDSGIYVFGTYDKEIGINVRRMQIRFFPEVNERFKDQYGNTFLRSVSTYFSRELTCEGEMTARAGVAAFTLGAVCSFATTHQNFFSPVAGSFFLDEAVISLDRRGWRSLSVRASSNPSL